MGPVRLLHLYIGMWFNPSCFERPMMKTWGLCRRGWTQRTRAAAAVMCGSRTATGTMRPRHLAPAQVPRAALTAEPPSAVRSRATPSCLAASTTARPPPAAVPAAPRRRPGRPTAPRPPRPLHPARSGLPRHPSRDNLPATACSPSAMQAYSRCAPPRNLICAYQLTA